MPNTPEEAAEARRSWRRTIARIVIVSLIAYTVVYVAFGMVLGFSARVLTFCLISTVVVWMAIPWIGLDVYANSRQGRTGDFASRAKGVSFLGSFLVGLFVLFAIVLGPGYGSLAFWTLTGATVSLYFSRTLIGAYERGRGDGNETK